MAFELLKGLGGVGLPLGSKIRKVLLITGLGIYSVMSSGCEVRGERSPIMDENKRTKKLEAGVHTYNDCFGEDGKVDYGEGY